MDQPPTPSASGASGASGAAGAAGVPRLPAGSGASGGGPRCSAKGCGAGAVQAVVWNNPKLHTPDREKVWLACDAHVEQLRSFLAVRDMLRYVEPLAARIARDAPTA